MAIILVRAIKGQLFTLAGTGFLIDYPNSGFLIYSIMGLVLIIWLSGLYPTILLSSFNPVVAMKGGPVHPRSVFRQVSVVIQYGVCIALLIGTFALHKQLGYVQSKDLGFERESVVSFEFFNEELWIEDVDQRSEHLDNLSFVFNELGKSSAVTAVGSSEFPLYEPSMDCWGFEEDPDRKTNVSIGKAGLDFPELYGIQVLEGRFYGDPKMTDKKGSTGARGIVINNTASRELFSGDALGKTFTMASWGKREVIGVVEDFHFRHLSRPITPSFLYRGGQVKKPVVRFKKGRLKEGMEYVRDLHKKIDAQVPLTYEFLDQELGRLYEKDMAITRLVSVLSAIALVVSCLGLFALSAHAVSRRVKEIGIRKVNGANVRNIFYMLSKDFLKWVIYAAIVAIPASWYLLHQWLQNYAHRTMISWWIYVVAGLLTAIISLLTISYHAAKASCTNPVDVLRNE